MDPKQQALFAMKMDLFGPVDGKRIVNVLCPEHVVGMIGFYRRKTGVLGQVQARTPATAPVSAVPVCVRVVIGVGNPLRVPPLVDPHRVALRAMQKR
jgi:hypothetical protein